MRLAKAIMKLDACLSMIFSENRCPLFRIMLQAENRKDSRELLDGLQVNPQPSIGARVAGQA
jgi:hypothetical protein